MASAGQIKGITIKIEGDTSGLAKDLQNVNSDIKQTEKALNEVEKALKLDPSNIELLATKQELLTKQIEQTEEKLKLEQQAAEDAKEALEIGNISAEEYATLQAEVAQTQHSLDDLTSSAGDAETSLDDAGGAADDAGDAASDAGDEMEDMGESASNAGDIAKTAFGIIAGAAATAAAEVGGLVAGIDGLAGAIKDAATEVSEMGDDIDKNSQRLGMSASEYQKWDYILKINGSSLDENSAAFKKLTNEIDKGKKGNKDIQKAFKKVGVSLKDLKTLSREEIFEKVIMGLQNIDDDATKAARANELLGKSGQTLMPLLNSTNDDLKKLSDQAEKYGIIIGDDLVKDSADYQDSLTLLDGAMKGLKARLAGQFLPGLTQITVGIAGLVAGVEGADKDVSEGVKNLVSTFEKVAPAVLQGIRDSLPILIPLGQEIIETLIKAIGDNLGPLLDSAVSIIHTITTALLTDENVEKIAKCAGEIMNALTLAFLAVVEDLIDPAIKCITTIVETLLKPDNLNKLIDAGINIIVAICEGLADCMPRILDAAETAIETIGNKLTENGSMERLQEAGLKLLEAVLKGLIKCLPKLIKWLLIDFPIELTKALLSVVGQLLLKAGEWGADLIEAFIDGIKSRIQALKNVVSGVAGTVKKYLGFSEPDMGPLSNFHTFAPDMIKLFSQGIIDSLPTLKAAVDQAAATVDTEMQPDYTSAINGISSQLEGLNNNGTYVINVNVGSQRLTSLVLSAQQMEKYRTGGI